MRTPVQEAVCSQFVSARSRQDDPGTFELGLARLEGWAKVGGRGWWE